MKKRKKKRARADTGGSKGSYCHHVNNTNSNGGVGRLFLAIWLTTATTITLPTAVEGQLNNGLVHTDSGYDNIVGDDAICWKAPRFDHTNNEKLQQAGFEGKHWKNSLVHNFHAGPTSMMSSCPSGTSLKLELYPKPKELTHGSSKLRTKQYYTFHFQLDIDLESWQNELDLDPEGAFFYSEKSRLSKNRTGYYFPQIALRLTFCPINGNLCTPFMFEGLGGTKGLGQLQVGMIEDTKLDNDDETKEKGDSNDEKDDYPRPPKPPETNGTDGLPLPPPKPPHHHYIDEQNNVIAYQYVSTATTTTHNSMNNNSKKNHKENNNRNLLLHNSRTETSSSKKEHQRQQQADATTNFFSGSRKLFRKVLTTFNIIEPTPEEAQEAQEAAQENNYWSLTYNWDGESDGSSSGGSGGGTNNNNNNNNQDAVPKQEQETQVPTTAATGTAQSTNTINNQQLPPPPPPFHPPPPPPPPPKDDNVNKTSLKQDLIIQGAAATPEFYVEIARDEGNNSTTTFQIHYNVEIQVQEPGDYLPMAAVLLFLTNETMPPPPRHVPPPLWPPNQPAPHEYPAYKIDIANLLHNRSVNFYDPIQINTISTAGKAISYVAIGICALVQLFMLGSTIYYRKENVMQLSQGGFLIALQVAALIAIVSTIFFQPKNSIFCILSGPMTLIPLQLIFAIVFGRLRRIYTIMAPLLSLKKNAGGTKMNHLRRGLRNWKAVMMRGGRGSLSSSAISEFRSRTSNSDDDETMLRGSSNTTAAAKESAPSSSPPSPSSSVAKRCKNFMRNILSRIPIVNKWAGYKESKASIRQEFTQTQLICLVGLVTSPMVFWEIFVIIFLEPELYLTLNEEESHGRYECGTEHTQRHQLISSAILFLTILLDLYQARSSQSLPAFFNESVAVFKGLTSSLLIASVGLSVLFVSDGPEGSPELTYWMEVLLVLSTALNMSIRLTLPKLRLVWRGEKVVVSHIIREHRQTEEAKKSKISDNNSTATGGPIISGLDSSYSNTTYRTGHGRVEAGVGDIESSRVSVAHHRTSSTTGELPIIDEDQSTGITAQGGGEEQKKVKIQEPPPQIRKRRTVVHPDEEPPSKLTIQLLSHCNNTQHVNEKVLSGYQVDKEEWKKLVESVDEFQALLQTYEFED